MKYWINWEPTKAAPKTCPFCGAKQKTLHQYGKWYSVWYRCETHLTSDERTRRLSQLTGSNAWRSPQCEANERRNKWIVAGGK